MKIRQLIRSTAPCKSVRRCQTHIPLDAQVEIVFIIEIMPNFQHDCLYSPSLTLSRPGGGGGRNPPPKVFPP